MSHKELIAQVKQIAESGVADYLNVGYQNSEILTKAADALESLTQQLAELQAKLEDALKDRVALARRQTRHTQRVQGPQRQARQIAADGFPRHARVESA